MKTFVFAAAICVVAAATLLGIAQARDRSDHLVSDYAGYMKNLPPTVKATIAFVPSNLRVQVRTVHTFCGTAVSSSDVDVMFRALRGQTTVARRIGPTANSYWCADYTAPTSPGKDIVQMIVSVPLHAASQIIRRAPVVVVRHIGS